MALAKNDILQLKIVSVTSDGDGVARTDEGIVVFVPNCAVGDLLSVKILKVKKNIAYGRVEEVLAPSSDRITPDCPVSRTCGGCVYRHIRYDAECRIKRQKVQDAVTRIGGLSADLVQDIIPCENIDSYRNKAMIPISLDREGRVEMGFYARHSHRIVPCIDCRLSPAVFNAITRDVYDYLCKRPEQVFTPSDRRGLRHLYLRYAQARDEVMVCFVAGSRDIPQLEMLYNSLTEKYPQIKSVILNINPDDTNVVLGKRNITLYGRDSITDTLCGLDFALSPPSFYQVNRDQAERLYALARQYAQLSPDDVLLDLYCGTGTIGLSMAADCAQLVGVEIVSEAIENAKRNASTNGIGNARFLCADAAAAAKQLRAEGLSPDVIIVDPPRKGLASELIDTIAEMSPDRVVYVSCDPATLARDLKLFTEHNYSVKEITPVDMFPRTAHVEAVVMMSREEDECID